MCPGSGSSRYTREDLEIEGARTSFVLDVLCSLNDARARGLLMLLG